MARALAPQKGLFAGIPKTRLGRQEAMWGLIFLSPWLFGLIFLYAMPMLASLVFSFTDLNPINASEAKFIGIDNYLRLLNDPDIAASAMVSIKFGLLAVPLRIISAMLAALLVNARRLSGKTVFRILFYLPAMIPAIGAGLVFSRLFNPTTGWINALIGLLGIDGPNWFGDPKVIVWGLVLLALWALGPGMIQDIAAFQNVPTELYEAAKVDGANPFYQFFRITLPLISNVIFFQILFGFIFALQYFEVAYLLGDGRGNPDGATMFYNLLLYRNAWVFNDMGYAAAMAWVLFIVACVVTILLFRSQKRWVFYAADRD